MTTLTQGRFQTASRSVLQPRPGLLASVAATFALWRRRSEERRALASFGWRDLHDIGVTPTEAMVEINKPFWKG